MATKKRIKRTRAVIGWREWIGLPDLGIPAIKVKVDTGARSSALHAFDFSERQVDGVRIVDFQAHPEPGREDVVVDCSAELVEHRAVTNSGGITTVRPVIRTRVALGGQTWEIDLTLVSREGMGFRMLLGREAVRRRFVVDPGRSFRHGGNEESPS